MEQEQEQTRALATVPKGSPEYRGSMLQTLCERQDCLFSPVAIQKTFAKVQTMERCMELTANGDLPTLLQMAHLPDNGDKVVALVALNIIALDAYLHLNNRLTQQEVDTIALDIVNIYGGALSFADLNIILTEARRGVYGRFYERLSGADIMSWIDAYYNKRLNEAAMRTQMRHERQAVRRRGDTMTRQDIAYYIFKEQFYKEQINSQSKTYKNGKNKKA